MNEQKSLSKRTKLSRIYFIDREIASGRYPSTRDLAKKYETSIPSISRDIEFMRDTLNAPIAYDTTRRGYCYTEKRFRIPAAFATADDLLALGMAKQFLSLYRDTPLYQTAKQFMDGIASPLEDGDNPMWYEKRIAVPPPAPAVVDSGVWNIIISGLRENKIITFDYRSASDEETFGRRVRPYQLLYDQGVWFLYGFSEERKGTRVFSLYRIKNAAPTEDRFTLPEDYTYINHTGGSNFGIFAADTKFTFKIKFYAEAAISVKERKWAQDQSFTDAEDGTIITFTSTQFDKVLEWLLSHGCYAKPIEPRELVDDWKWHIEELSGMTGEEA
ncbi:MAG: WYL domain-containing protein [Treponema sp.]|jgi:predicted DNA-binding transcriptional regulator YafY|nr:WYL domain-containing protein [Treponema sp.]